MANEMPKPDEYTGHSRTVLAYSEAFSAIMARAKTHALTPADWEKFELLVDVDAFRRVGVFTSQETETSGWKDYTSTISHYASVADFEATLRHITESGDRVILALEERNTVNGVLHVANTVTIYEFNPAGKIHHLEVYVMSLS
jgi:hypothetical protein